MNKLFVFIFARKKSFTIQICYAGILLLLSLAVVWHYNPLLKHVSSGKEYSVALALSAIGLVLSVYILNLLGKLGLFLAPVVSGILMAFTYATAVYGLEPGPSFIGAVMETTLEEASAFSSFDAVAFVVAGMVAYTFVVLIAGRFFSTLNYPIFFLLFVHLIFAQSRIFTKDATKEMRHAARWSMEYVSDPVKYAVDFPFRDKEKVSDLRALPNPAAVPLRRVEDEPLTIVLVIGESLRADHLGINGYHRETTPRLAREDLVNFPDALSFAALTRESVVAIFSDREPGASKARHGSFVSVFLKLGFAVTTYSANTKPNRSDFSFSIMTEGAKRFFTPRPDMTMVERFRGQVGTAAHELHILSPYGSHFGYRDGYPPQEAVFKPDTYTRPLKVEERSVIINSYDNTVVYTDKILAELINELRGRNAIMFYVSDHGESLGENGRFAHGDNNAPEQRKIPFFLWFSDNYKKKHADTVAALRARTTEQVTHHHVFHTMLGLAGIEIPVRDARLDLTAPAEAGSVVQPR